MTKARDLASSTPVPSTVSTTELGYVDGVTSAIQTQVDSKLATATASSTYQTKAAAGLVLINTTNFSGVPSQSINSCFSATYDNYKFILRVESTTASLNTINLRFGTNGTPNTTSVYNVRGYYMDGVGNPLAFSASNQTAISIVTDPNNNTGGYSYSADIFNPFIAFETIVPGRGGSFLNLRDTNTIGFFDGSTSFTDLIVLPTSGNFTGSISVYGYNK
jgi:hypothetical protein